MATQQSIEVSIADADLFRDAYKEAKELVKDYRGDPNSSTYRFALALIKSVEADHEGR